MSLLPNLQPQALAHQRVCVLGAGESGLAMARWLKYHQANVFVADSREDPPHLAALDALDISCKTSAWSDQAVFAQGEWLNDTDWVAISPGIAPASMIEQVVIERKLPMVGEVTLFLEAMKEYAPETKLLAITGSNGKTTTTALVHAMLQAAGGSSTMAGNIYPSLLDRCLKSLEENFFPSYWVIELSSFQLARLNKADLFLGAVLNVADNHLDWHRSMEDYVHCKKNLLRCAKEILVNVDDEEVLGMLSSLTQKTCHAFSLMEKDRKQILPSDLVQGEYWYSKDNVLKEFEGLLPTVNRNQSLLLGSHNTQNILAALAIVSIALDQNHALIKASLQGIQQFRGMPHRTMLIAQDNGVDWVNDSKSTTVASTCAALSGIEKPTLLLVGGLGKNQDFSLLRDAVMRHAKQVLLYGASVEVIAKALEGLPIEKVADLKAAVIRAEGLAEAGDCVLLSPACASFDQFNNYEDRGESFITLVKAQLENHAQRRGSPEKKSLEAL